MDRLECTTGGSSKFWEGSTRGSTLVVRFGRLGTEGQIKEKSLGSEKLALEELDKLVREKLAKGYVRKTKSKAKTTTPADAPLLALADLLGGGTSARTEIAMALEEPAKYVAKFKKRLAERGIDEPEDGLAEIALLDALEAAGKLREIDWKTSATDLTWNLDALLAKEASAERWSFMLDPKYDDMETELLLKVASGALAAEGKLLAAIDTGSDSYALVLLSDDTLARAKSLAKAAGFAGVEAFRGKTPPPAKKTAPSGLAKPTSKNIKGLWDIVGQHGTTLVGAEEFDSTWIDVSSAPPRVHRRTGEYIWRAAGGGPNGAWVVASEIDKKAERRMFVPRILEDPFGEGSSREVPFAEAGLRASIANVGFIGQRVIAFPSDARPLLETDGALSPAPGLPAPKESGDIAVGVLGDGTPLIVYAGHAWFWTGTSFEKGPKASGSTILAAAADAAYVLDGGVAEVKRGRATLAHPLGDDDDFTFIAEGPFGGIVLVENEFDDKPALSWVWIPAKELVIRIERKLLGTRECNWALWSPEARALLVYDDPKLYSIPEHLLTTLPRTSAKTKRRITANEPL